MKTIVMYPELARLEAAFNVTSTFRARLDISVSALDDGTEMDNTSLFVKYQDGARACWSVWHDASAPHPYEIHFMPATADGQHMDDDKYQEYTVGAMSDVLLCILEDWQSINH